MDDEMKKKLDNSYEAYEYFPFNQRFEAFKLKKEYFLFGLSEDEVKIEFHQFIFFHFVISHRLYPKLSKIELLNYYHKRKNERSN